MPDPTDQRSLSRHIIAWSDLTAQPWRNGGGITRQILSRRVEKSGDWVPCSDGDWDWRLSIADVDSAGAFSSFSGMTRILTIIEGISVMLTVNGEVEQLEKHRPFRFDGGAETSAELPHGPIRDLNLIARSGTVDAAVRVETLSADRSHVVPHGQFCVLLDGTARLSTGAELTTDLKLERYDTILGDATHPPTIDGDGILAVITVSSAA